MGIAALLLGLVALGVMVYVVTVLKITVLSLQTELTQFKQGGFRTWIKEELSLLTQKADQDRVQLLDLEKKRTAATQEFNQGLGMVVTQIKSLSELQTRVGELNDLLKPQQLRGELGEVIVRTLIADKLPTSQYEEDHTFADGKKVEFVIRLNDKLIPVDSKLQLEDFKRMREAPEDRRASYRTEFKRKVKQKIDEVKEYIRPEEGTHNFALMVIPSEAVYYDLVASKDFTEQGGLYDYARSQNVFPVSPLTFWAYVTAIAQGLHGLEIERRAEEILASLQTISSGIQHFYQEEFRVLGDHVRDAAKKYDEARNKLADIREDLTHLERIKADELTERGVAA